MNWLWYCLNLILLFSQAPKCRSSSISDLFDTWCKDYDKTYASEQEKEHRFKVFQQNYEFVTHHNSRANASYTLSLNAFADLTNHEFKSKYLGLSPSANDSLIRLNTRSVDFVSESDIPSSIDWRKKGAVTGVKDQGSCGMLILLPFSFITQIPSFARLIVPLPFIYSYILCMFIYNVVCVVMV